MKGSFKVANFVVLGVLFTLLFFVFSAEFVGFKLPLKPSDNPGLWMLFSACCLWDLRRRWQQQNSNPSPQLSGPAT